MEWARTSDGKESDLDHLLQFLQLEIARRDRSQVYTELTKQGRLTGATSGGHSAGGATRQGGPARQDRPAAAATSGRRPAAAAAQLQLITESCSYCGQPHRTAKCRGWGALTVRERRGIARERQLCYRCLRSGHLLFQCKEVERCGECQGKHHVTLCEKETGGRVRGPQGIEGGGGTSVGGPPRPASGLGKGGGGRSESASLSCTTSGGGVTVLPLATVTVPLADGRSVVTGTLIFDGVQIDRLSLRTLGRKYRATSRVQWRCVVPHLEEQR